MRLITFKENKNIFHFLSFLALLIYFYYLGGIESILTFENYQDLGLISDDELFLAEQILFSFGKFDKIYLNFELAQYGTEFFLIKYFLLLINFVHNLDEAEVIKILITFHFILGFSTLFVFQKILKNLKIKRKFFIYLILPLVFILDKKFIFNFFSLKPDLNVCLFSISVSLYYLVKPISKRSILLSLVFAALALSVKLWGLFLLIPIIYYYCVNNINLENFFFDKELKIYSFLTIFLLSCIYIKNLFFLKNYFELSSFFLVFLIISYFFIILLFLYIFKIIKKKINSFITRNIFVTSLLFIFFVLCFTVPLSINSEIFLKSIKYFGFDVTRYGYSIYQELYFINFFKSLFLFLKNRSFIDLLPFLILIFSLNKISHFCRILIFISAQILVFYLIYGRMNVAIYIPFILIWLVAIIQLDFLIDIKYSTNQKFKLFFLFLAFLFLNIQNLSYNYNIYHYPIINYNTEKIRIEKGILNLLKESSYKKNVNIFLCQKKFNTDFLTEKFKITYLDKYKGCSYNKISKQVNEQSNNFLILIDYQSRYFDLNKFKKIDILNYDIFQNFVKKNKSIYVLQIS